VDAVVVEGLQKRSGATRAVAGVSLTANRRLWSGAGSNRRPSAFQVSRAERCADLQKRTSPTSGTALGGRCRIHASRKLGIADANRSTGGRSVPEAGLAASLQ
jgi:hypothetical protein